MNGINPDRTAKMLTVGGAARRLALAYGPQGGIAPLALAFDDRLADVTLTPGEPMLAQLKLAWWREQLATIGGARDPLLIALHAAMSEQRVSSTTLRAMIDGWEALLTLDDEVAALTAHASGRGVILPWGGPAWALWDLALRGAAGTWSRGAWMLGRRLVHESGEMPPSSGRNARPLVALALAARAELARTPEPCAPGLRTWLRIVRAGLTGR